MIIPAFNRCDTVARAISSALAQTQPPLEVIVVDDASNDATADVVRALAAVDPRIRLLSAHLNLGGAAARNRGIEAANGEILAFLDSDDEWMPHHLERSVQALVEQPGTTLVFGSFLVQGRGSTFQRHCLPFQGDPLEYIFYGRGGIRTSTFVGTSAGIRKVMFDGSLRKHQDWDLMINLVREARIRCRSEPTVILHVSSGDRLSARPDAEASVKFFRKNFGACTRTGWILFFAFLLDSTYCRGSANADFQAHLERLRGIDARAGAAIGRIALLLDLPWIGRRLFRSASRMYCRATAASRSESMN